MTTPTVERPPAAPRTPLRVLPQTQIGWCALGMQAAAVILAACWPPLGRALGHLNWGPWGVVLPVAAAAVVIGAGSVAIFRAKERSILLMVLFGVTTAVFVLVGLLLVGFALTNPDLNPNG